MSEVAARAGVSVSTASRALAGIGVKKGNMRKVEAAAQELGYIRNEAARALRNVKSMTVGVVFKELTGLFGLELISAISSRIESEGYCALIAIAQGDPNRYDELVYNFLERRVDALICVHATGTGEHLEGYRRAGIPVIGVLSREEAYAEVPLITTNLDPATEHCFTRIAQHGHKKVRVLIRQEVETGVLKKITECTELAGVEVISELIPEGRFNAAAYIRRAQLEGEPSVVIASHSDAAQVLATAQAIDVAVPQALSVVGVREARAAVTSAHEELSLIRITPNKLGEKVGEVLLAQLHDQFVAQNTTLVDSAEFDEGRTLGPCPTV